MLKYLVLKIFPLGKYLTNKSFVYFPFYIFQYCTETFLTKRYEKWSIGNLYKAKLIKCNNFKFTLISKRWLHLTIAYKAKQDILFDFTGFWSASKRLSLELLGTIFQSAKPTDRLDVEMLWSAVRESGSWNETFHSAERILTYYDTHGDIGVKIRK